MPFDPSTARPVASKFDPSSARPLEAPSESAVSNVAGPNVTAANGASDVSDIGQSQQPSMGVLDRLKGGALSYGKQYLNDMGSSWTQLKNDLREAVPDQEEFKNADFWDATGKQINALIGAGKSFRDAVGLVLSPLTAATDVATTATGDLAHNAIPALNAQLVKETLDEILPMMAPEGGLRSMARPLPPLGAPKPPLPTGPAGVAVTPAQERAIEIIENKAGGPVEVDPRQIVPGSEPTLVHSLVTDNAGVSELQRALRDTTSNRTIVQREADQNAARKQFFDSLHGNAGDPESLDLARSAITGPMRKAVFANKTDADPSNVMKVIQNTLASPAGQEDAVVKQMQAIAKKLQVANPLDERVDDALGPINAKLKAEGVGATARANLVEARRLLNNAKSGKISEDDLVSGLNDIAKTQKTVGPIEDAIDVIKAGPVGLQTDPEQLYGIRKNINNRLRAVAGSENADAKLATKELMDVRDALDEAIEPAAPGFKDYVNKFAEMSRPIDRLDYLKSMGLNLVDSTGKITLQKVQNAIKSATLGRAARGIHDAKSLSDEDMHALEMIRDDLLQSGKLSNGKSVGSNTFQNIIANKGLAEAQALPDEATLFPSIDKETIGKVAGGVVGHTVAGGLGHMVGKYLGGAVGKYSDVAGEAGSEALRAQQLKETSAALEDMILHPAQYTAAKQAIAVRDAARAKEAALNNPPAPTPEQKMPNATVIPHQPSRIVPGLLFTNAALSNHGSDEPGLINRAWNDLTTR